MIRILAFVILTLESLVMLVVGALRIMRPGFKVEIYDSIQCGLLVAIALLLFDLKSGSEERGE